MGEIRRIRRNFPSADDRYVVCDTNGKPLYTWYDKNRLKSGMKDLKSEHTVIEELDQHPDVTGLPGATAAEKVAYANWQWSNNLRMPKKFGYMSEHDDSGQVEELYDAGAEDIYQDTRNAVNEDKPELQRLLETLKDQDTLIILRLDSIAQNAKQGAETVLQLLERGVKVEILSEDVSINAYSKAGEMIVKMLRSIVHIDENTPMRSRADKQSKASHPGGRPRVYSQEQLDEAMTMLKTNSYKEVEKTIGISKSTLIREKRRRATEGGLK